MSSSAKGSSLTSADHTPALDQEVIELLRDDEQLLAIADAVAATQRPQGGGAPASGPRPLSESGDQRDATGRRRPRPRKS